MSDEEAVPISVVKLGEDVERLLLDVVRSGVIAQGPVVRRLEDEFAALIDVRNVVAVNNGTSALIAALRVLDLGPGDEVVTSPFTFVATLNAILDAGAAVRFADISAEDFCVNAATIEGVMTDRTKVLLPIHLYGQSADMPGIMALAERSGAHVVEDAAQAHGATYGGRATGTWGIGCFSLYATKNLTAGEGGLVSTDDDELAERLRILRNQGMRRRYEYEMAGNNYRMTDLHAAICVPQLATYSEQVEARRSNAQQLTEGLTGLTGLRTPRQLDDRGHVWHQYTVLVDDDAPLTRDDVVAGLEERGISSGVYYPKLVFDYDCYRGDPRVVVNEYPVATDVARRCVSIPVHHHLTQSQVHRVVEAMRSLWDG